MAGDVGHAVRLERLPTDEVIDELVAAVHVAVDATESRLIGEHVEQRADGVAIAQISTPALETQDAERCLGRNALAQCHQPALSDSDPSIPAYSARAIAGAT